MKNLYQVYPAIITDIEEQSPTVRLFTMKADDTKNIQCAQDENRLAKCWWPGQFLILSVSGFGEAPFAICSSPSPCGEFQVCVQKKGVVTSKLFTLGIGSYVSFRGPYGNGFPLSKIKGRNILLISGGLGLAPLRPLIQLINRQPAEFKSVQLLSGSREERFMLFKKEYKLWQKYIETDFTLDIANENWNGNVGMITALIDKTKFAKDPVVIMCGPPIMYPSVIKRLKKKKIKEEDIYILMERRMHCGVGYCQHCVLVNGLYVCKDGPVFNYAEIKNSPNAI